MNKLLKELEDKRNRLKEETEIFDLFTSTLEVILEEFPQEISDKSTLNSIYASKRYNELLMIDVTVWLPYIPALINKAKYYLKNIGCTNIEERDSWNKEDLYVNGEKYISEKNYIEFSFLFRGASKSATCILVPLEQKVKREIEVQLYDRICPESHPDLFTKDEQGNYIYIGDNVFPALEG